MTDNNKIQANLTEQWKNGELSDGYYYCKLILNNMKPSVERCKAHCIPMGVSADKGEEVLAPVPSYEEWQLMQDDNKRLKHDVGNLGYKIKNQRHEIDNRLKEIEKLKELLQQAEKQIIVYKNNDTLPERAFYEKEVEELLTKIDEVLK